MNTEPIYSIITGASSGLGREFAVQCARMKMNLILISLPGSHIQHIASQLQELYGIDVKVYEFDLTDAVELQQKIGHITNHYKINFLINNAGVGGTATIVDCPVRVIDNIIQLNIRSTTLLTRLLLPALMKNKKSYILNISSMAAFTPLAYKTVYPASKAFVSSFALGLRQELFSEGVSVSVVYPGPIMTNSNASVRILLQGFKARIGLLSASGIVAKALRQTLQGKAIIVPGFWNRLNYKLMALIPVLYKTKMISGNIRQELLPQYR